MSRTRTTGRRALDVPELDVVGALEREWPALAPRLAPALREWQRREPALAAFSSPQLLVRFLQRVDADLDAKDATLTALLRCTQTDSRAGRVILQALLPGLKRLAERLIREPGARAGVWSSLLSAVWERMYSYPLLRRPQRVAANLLLDTRLAVRQERERARHAAARELALADPQPPPRSLPFAIERPLRRAIDAGAITAEEAELIAQTRIDGMSLVELSAATGIEYDALRKRAGGLSGGCCSSSAGLMSGLRVEIDVPLVLGSSAPGSRAAPAEEPSPTRSRGGERARRPRSRRPSSHATARKEEMPRKLTIALALATVVALVACPAALAANDLNQVIENLRVWITGLLAGLATLLLMIGGVRYLFAGGDPGQHERAKGSIRAALIGYALALLAPVLVSIVQQIVGK